MHTFAASTPMVVIGAPVAEIASVAETAGICDESTLLVTFLIRDVLYASIFSGLCSFITSQIVYIHESKIIFVIKTNKYTPFLYLFRIPPFYFRESYRKF